MSKRDWGASGDTRTKSQQTLWPFLGVSGVSHLCGTPSRRPGPPKDLDREKIEGDKGEMYRDQAHFTSQIRKS